MTYRAIDTRAVDRDSHALRWLGLSAVLVLLAFVGFAGYVTYRLPAALDAGFGELFGPGHLDGCCQRPPAGSRVERAGAVIARIGQVGEAPRGHLMLLAARVERRITEPDTALVGRFVTDSTPGRALIVALVPRDSVVDVTPAATLVLGTGGRLVQIYRR